MRNLLLDAAEALWALITAPLRKLIADAFIEAMIHNTGPGLRWPAQAPQDCALGPEPEWLLDFYTELAHRPEEQQ